MARSRMNFTDIKLTENAFRNGFCYDRNTALPSVAVRKLLYQFNNDEYLFGIFSQTDNYVSF